MRSVLLVHVEEDVARSFPPLSNVLLLGLSHVAVVIASPHSLPTTAHITNVVPCSTVRTIILTHVKKMGHGHKYGLYIVADLLKMLFQYG